MGISLVDFTRTHKDFLPTNLGYHTQILAFEVRKGKSEVLIADPL